MLSVTIVTRLNSRAEVFNWLMSMSVNALYDRTRLIYEKIGIKPDEAASLRGEDREAMDLAMDGFHISAEAQLDKHLYDFVLDIAKIQLTETEVK